MNSTIRHMAVWGAQIYWIENGRDGTRGRLMTADARGEKRGTLTMLPEGSVMGMAADDRFVYWTSQEPKSVFKVSVAGGVPTTVALDQAWPYEIVVDESRVYWTNREGEDVVASRPRSE
jgi:hypothetical protein